MRKNTIERRLEQASATKQSALSAFTKAADDLDATAAVAEALSDEADKKRRHYESLTLTATQEAASARSAAAKIRSLVSA